MYNRLYKKGTSNQGGTLLQLRNVINRRNIAANISGCFNAAIDFFELVCNCHIVAAAMHFLEWYQLVMIRHVMLCHHKLANGAVLSSGTHSLKLLVS